MMWCELRSGHFRLLREAERRIHEVMKRIAFRNECARLIPLCDDAKTRT
jgi:hypothetical protein